MPPPTYPVSKITPSQRKALIKQSVHNYLLNPTLSDSRTPKLRSLAKSIHTSYRNLYGNTKTGTPPLKKPNRVKKQNAMYKKTRSAPTPTSKKHKIPKKKESRESIKRLIQRMIKNNFEEIENKENLQQRITIYNYILSKENLSPQKKRKILKKLGITQSSQTNISAFMRNNLQNLAKTA